MNNIHSSKILVAGGSGFIGSHFRKKAKENGHQIKILTRNPISSHLKNDAHYDEISVWDPTLCLNSAEQSRKLTKNIQDCHTILNLTGFSVAKGRFNKKHKTALESSRLEPTQALLNAYSNCTPKPKTWIQASAIGYYGNRGEEEITEKNLSGDNFLAYLCQKWENTLLEQEIFKKNHTRLIILRIGIVLSKDAPAWKQMLLPIKMGIGGSLGNGKQWYSWIHLEDVINAILFLEKSQLEGIFNLTAPNPIRQKELVKETAKKINRPYFIRTPAFVLKMLLGDLANNLILCSCKVLPYRLKEKGFTFKYENFSSALESLMHQEE